LTAIALTDHDTVEGCMPTKLLCELAGIEFIAGVELTAELDGHELHLLGYGLDVLRADLLFELARFQLARQDRIREMVLRLNQMNIPVEAEQVFILANCRSPGRPHLARALLKGGFCSSYGEAFDRFLKRNRPAWAPKYKMSALDAIALIHRNGGVAILAHPALNQIDHGIPELVAAGIDGIECFHTKHSGSDQDHYLAIAQHYGLLITGGSDCHGMSKGSPTMGQCKLPYPYVKSLKEKLAHGRNGSSCQDKGIITGVNG
jgi:hypothetical protein